MEKDWEGEGVDKVFHGSFHILGNTVLCRRKCKW